MRTIAIRSSLALAVALAFASGCAAPSDTDVDVDADANHDLGADERATSTSVQALARKGRYIVTLKEGAEDDVEGRVEALLRAHGGRKGHVYTSALQGYSVELPPGVAEVLRRDPRVASVTEEAVGELDGYQSSPGWGLDRLDDPKGLDGSFSFGFTGAGVHLYLLDTGIARYHAEFGERVGDGFGACDACDPFEDADGHGSGVASIAAGATTGVARGAAIHPVKISQWGPIAESDMLAGIDWIASHARRPAVVNSSNYVATAAVAAALSSLVQKGITVVKSGGNHQRDACLDPTNTIADAIVVGAMTSADTPASFTNWGSCITTHAPGVDVRMATNHVSGGAVYDENPLPSFKTASGTSVAAPYVAGIAATLLQQSSLLTPKTVKSTLVTTAWAGKLTGLKPGTPNRVANSTPGIAEINLTDIDSSELYDTTGVFSWFHGTFDPSSTYEWERSINGGVFTKVGSLYTYSMTIQQGATFNMTLRRTSTWQGIKTVKTFSVKVMNKAAYCKWGVCDDL